MRAGAVDDDKILRRNVAQFSKQPGQEPLGRQRARDVWNDDGHAIRRRYEVFQRFGIERGAYGLAELDGFIGQAGQKAWGKQGNVGGRKVYVQSVLAILKVNLHK